MAKRTEAGEPLHLITNAGAATGGSEVPTAISADLARRSRLRADEVHAGLPIMDSVLLPGSREWHQEAVGLYSVLDKGLETATSLMQADRGTMQIPDPATGSLRIAVQAGFSAEFLQYFARVDDDTSACGRAASQRAQMVIADVNADPGFARHRDIAAASRFRAVQSTPLVDMGAGWWVCCRPTIRAPAVRPRPGNHATVRRTHRAGHRGVPERRSRS
jgi:GAF domain